MTKKTPLHAKLFPVLLNKPEALTTSIANGNVRCKWSSWSIQFFNVAKGFFGRFNLQKYCMTRSLVTKCK